MIDPHTIPERVEAKTNSGLRGAWTLIEVLVVLAVIGLLTALLIPAVQSAREAARRTSCLSNLRQLGVAMHAYHDTHRIFPPGTTNRFSAFVSMLPYLDQGTLYQQVDFSVIPRLAPNDKLLSHQLSVLQCLSDPGSFSRQGVTSYVGNNGAGLHVDGIVLGVFSLLVKDVNGGGPVSSGMISDGLSNTAAFSEVLIGDGSQSARRAVWQAPRIADPNMSDLFVKECETLDPSAQRGGGWDRGGQWTDGNYPSTLYNHTAPPNHRACTNDGDIFWGSFPAASLHTGGVLVCFADGATRFISDSIDVETWRAIGTRSSGELIGEF